MANLIGKDELNSLYNPKTMVYKATHEIVGEEWKRSSLMNKSFISFSYGGKFIEDFDLIAVINNDRLQRPIYGNFEDSVTTYETLDGQYYWGTHFTNNSLDLILATDGITEAKLNEFKAWFSPGSIRELWLSENPNRGIMARISTAPTYSFIPFEEKITHTIDTIKYSTSTTIYKGEINLSFIMDDPFWYSRAPLINYYYYDVDDKIASMTDVRTDGALDTLNDKDFIKIIAEDNIPHISMLQTDAFLAENKCAMIYGSSDTSIGSQIVGDDVNQGDYTYAHIDDGELPYTAIIGVVLGERRNNEYQVNLNTDINTSYLYYSGTAPSKPIITFTLKPYISNYFIAAPFNKYTTELSNSHYNILTIGNAKLKFSTPSLYNGYNQAISIVNSINSGDAFLDVETALRIGVNEYYARAWSLHSLRLLNNANYVSDGGAILNKDSFFNQFYIEMRKFITDNNDNYLTATFTFNSQTGETRGNFNIRAIVNGAETFLVISETTGDMLKSGHIILKERNYPNEHGIISNVNCSAITTDYPTIAGGLQNLLISFKNMYL